MTCPFCLQNLVKRILSFPLLEGATLILLAVCTTSAQLSAPSPATVNPRGLEMSEELSESLANDLLELSVVTKNRDIEKTAQFFPQRLHAERFPSEPTATKPAVKWIVSHGWSAQPAALSPGTAGDITAAEFLYGWAAFLDHFSEVEDARIKGQVANFDDSAPAIIRADVPTAVPGATGHARGAFFEVDVDVD